MDKLKYKKIKLAKCKERRRRKQDNIKFQQDKTRLFRGLEGEEAQEGKIPEIEIFVKFWEGIWEKEGKTPNMPWMEEIRRQLNVKLNEVNEFNITFAKVKKEVAKRKEWTAWCIDGIQNYWCKKLKPAQKALIRAFTKIKDDNKNIPLGGQLEELCYQKPKTYRMCKITTI